MQKARTAQKIALLAIFCLAAVFSLPGQVEAAAGGIQSCTVGATCKIGEFLYDDASAPVAGATCTITSKYPDNTDYINPAVAMSGGGADGWYYYEFTTPSTQGVYATSVCCTTSGDTLCIDKSFEAVAADDSASDVATAVWGYSSGRTLSSFGTLASDIWGYSTRTVSSFGTLVADIWSSATRTITGAGLSSGSLATKSDVDSVQSQTNITNVTNNTTEIKNTVAETRLLLEKIVNQPIIQNVLEEEVPDLSSKLKDTRAIANQIYVNSQYLTSQAGSLAAGWSGSGGKELLSKVIELSGVLGEESDSSSIDSVFGQVNWMRDSWSWDETTSIYNKLVAIRKRTDLLKERLSTYQKDQTLYYEAKSLVKDFLAVEKLVGTANDGYYDKSLYAKIKTTQEIASSLDEKSGDIDKLLASFAKSKEIAGVAKKVEDIQRQVVAINKVPSVTSVLAKLSLLTDFKSVKNALLGLRGIIGANKMLLAQGAGKTLVNTWLEEGSMVFKTLATNPSNLISQKVQVNYYLPSEVKEEDIIEADPGLTVSYDAEKGQLKVGGEFTLAAGATRTFSVKVNDIWQITKEEVDSLRRQTDELYKPLEKTAYFAQAVSLKSDINASLDRILALQEAAVTPEQKIKAYREASIIKNSAEEKLAGLKNLVGQASAASGLFGFVGGSQTIAVWGLIIIIAAGFVFLTIYMRTIINNGRKEALAEAPIKKAGGRKLDQIKLLAMIIIAASLSAAVTGFIVSKLVARTYDKKLSVLGDNIELLEKRPATDSSCLQSEGSTPPADEGVGGVDIVKIVVPLGSKVNVRKDPSLEGDIVLTLGASLDATRLEENGEWTKVSIVDEITPEKTTEGWVSSQFVKDGSGPEIIINATPTGWLRVRKNPEGEEIGKVFPGEKYLLVEDAAGWFQIVLTDGSFGWISKSYAKII